MSDRRGKLVHINKTGERLTGHGKEELLGKSLLGLAGERRISTAVLWARSALGRGAGPREFILRRSDGTDVVLEVSTFPISS